jgi:hypothetical protein
VKPSGLMTVSFFLDTRVKRDGNEDFMNKVERRKIKPKRQNKKKIKKTPFVLNELSQHC